MVARSVCGAARAVAPRAAEEPEAIVESRGDLRRRERRDARGGELDGEREAVEAPADLGDGGGVVVGQLERRRGGASALIEQPHGRGRDGKRRARARRVSPGDAERLAAGGEHAQPRRRRAGAPRRAARTRRRGARSCRTRGAARGRRASPQSCAIAGRPVCARSPSAASDGGRRASVGSSSGASSTQTDAVGEPGVRHGGRLDGEARLAAAARAGEAEQSSRVEQPAHLAKLRLASDEAGERIGKQLGGVSRTRRSGAAAAGLACRTAKDSISGSGKRGREDR